MRSHEPAAIGKHRVGAGQLQWRDLHHRLTDGGTGHVLRDPWHRARIGPAPPTLSPELITDQADAFLPVNFYARLALKAELISRLFQRQGSNTDSHLIEEGIAGMAQRIDIADRAKTLPVVL